MTDRLEDIRKLEIRCHYDVFVATSARDRIQRMCTVDFPDGNTWADAPLFSFQHIVAYHQHKIDTWDAKLMMLDAARRDLRNER